MVMSIPGRGGYNPDNSARGIKPAYQVAPQTVIQGKARPAPKVNYSAPPSTSSSGQYSGGTSYSSGGGSPSSAPSGNRQGPIQPSGPSPQEIARQQARQQRIQQRKERQQKLAQQKKNQQRRQEFRNFLPSDEVYQSSLASLQKELEDYILSNKDQQGDVRENFDLTTKRLGTERERALEQMKEDFAARGMLQSSEFSDSIGNYDKDYQQRVGDLSRDRDEQIEQLLESLGLYQTQTANERQNARAEAIRRRTERFQGWAPKAK